AARVHHNVGHPAHEVLAEADLRVHEAGGGDHLAAGEVAEMAGNGGGADVEGDAEAAVVEAGPDGGDDLTAVHGDSNSPVAGAQGLLQALQDAQVGLE